MNCSIDLRGWYWIIDFFSYGEQGSAGGILSTSAFLKILPTALLSVTIYRVWTSINTLNISQMLLLNVVGEDILRYLVATMLIQVRPSASLILLWDSLCLLLEPVYLTLWPVWWWQEKVNISVMFDQQHFIIVLDIVWGQLLKKNNKKNPHGFAPKPFYELQKTRRNRILKFCVNILKSNMWTCFLFIRESWHGHVQHCGL